jgi:hypothetical protein
MVEYSPELVGIICERLANGESLRQICRDTDMPAIGTFMRWCNENKDLQEHYARAINIRADLIFDEIEDIASAAITADNPNEIAGRRLLVDTQKWRLARMSPKKYGDRISTEVSGPDGAPVSHDVTVKFV